MSRPTRTHDANRRCGCAVVCPRRGGDRQDAHPRHRLSAPRAWRSCVPFCGDSMADRCGYTDPRVRPGRGPYGRNLDTLRMSDMPRLPGMSVLPRYGGSAQVRLT